MERDIPYVPGGDHQQQLDLYLPTGKDFPTLIFVHGGSLTSEDKNDPPYERLCPAFQAAGIGCANVNYRLARHAKWPAMPKDVAAAFAWARKNVASRGGDPKRVFLEEAAAFARKLQEAGVEADVRILEGRKHMSAVEKMPEPGDLTFTMVCDFIRKERRGTLR